MNLFGQKRWSVAPPIPPALLDRLRTAHPLLDHPLVAQILYNRGIVDAEDAHAFIEGAYTEGQPFALRDMDRAVDLLRRAIREREGIVIYGDYDADGVTASAVLVQVLRSLGARVQYYIPSRAEEGYGLNREAIGGLAQDGVQVLVTADCGIRSLEEVALAKRLGMQVIITDHHHPGPAFPQADAILNPRRPDCPYPFKDLAGVGVAFKLAQALLMANRKVALPTTQAEVDESELLDLVAVGTIADMVPLLGENHALVAAGLRRLNQGLRPGLNALMQVAGARPGQITAKTIGFALAPRLNAAGRMSEAATSLELLLAPDMASALPLAHELDALNAERRDLTLQVREQARSMVDQESVPPLIFAASDAFPQGVVGLAASRLLDEFYRPAVVVAVEGDLSKGSARSIPEFHITEALDGLSEFLVRHGGHAAAAGFTVRTESLEAFSDRLQALARERLEGVVLSPVLNADATVGLEGLDEAFYAALERLQPFGYGNPEPVWISRRVRVRQARAVGAEGQHLKLGLEDASGRRWDAIAFRQGHWFGRLADWIDIAFVLEMNTWNGMTNLQLNIQDLRSA